MGRWRSLAVSLSWGGFCFLGNGKCWCWSHCFAVPIPVGLVSLVIFFFFFFSFWFALLLYIHTVHAMFSVCSTFLLGLAFGPWVIQGQQQRVLDEFAPFEERLLAGLDMEFGLRRHGCESAVSLLSYLFLRISPFKVSFCSLSMGYHVLPRPRMLIMI